MRKTFKATCALAWLCAASANAQPASSACGALEFNTEVVMADSHTSLCPKPVDATLEQLQSKLERTPGKNTAVFFEVLKSLRDHVEPAPSDTESVSWRAALAEHIAVVLERAKKTQRRPPAEFAAVHAPTPALDPESCLFMTGDAGTSDYACYVIAGTPRPTHVLGAPAAMSVFELTDFADAYIAHRALGVAYGALVKLDVPVLVVALQRLTEANQRWNNLRKSGYLQYPWELWFSSALPAYRNYQACFAQDAYCSGEEGLDPEQLRLIALHPGVGMGFSGFGWKQKPSSDAALALSLEVLGVTYCQANFQNYLGASLGAVVNDGDFRDVRPGVFVHVTHWLHVGYLMSLFRHDSRFDATLFVSTDLASVLGIDYFD